MRYLGLAVFFATSTRVRLLLRKSVIHNQVLSFLRVHDAFAARERGVRTGRTCVGRSDLCGSFEWRKFAVFVMPQLLQTGGRRRVVRHEDEVREKHRKYGLEE